MLIDKANEGEYIGLRCHDNEVFHGYSNGSMLDFGERHPDLRRHCAHYDVTVMSNQKLYTLWTHHIITATSCDTITSWRLRSPKIWMFVQQLVYTNDKEYPSLLVLCEGNPPLTGRFPSQRASNTEAVSISWRHHAQEYRRLWSEWVTVIWLSRAAQHTNFVSLRISADTVPERTVFRTPKHKPC